MPKRDRRPLSDEVLEVLRERTVAMAALGHSQRTIAAALGLHKNTVSRWLKAWRADGAAALKPRQRGRRPQEQMLVSAAQAAEVQQLITEHCPDQLGLPFALWGREAVRDLIRSRYGITLAIRTVGDYLRRWGFTPQRPVKRALERQDARIRAWLSKEYPRIARRAKAEGAEVQWGDETGLSNQANYGRSFAPKGQTPVIRRTAKRHTTSLISTLTNRGTLRFMIYEGALNAGLFLTFLKRLVRSADRKVFLIIDHLKVHHATLVTTWVAANPDKIELFFLPAYAPEHNPDEFLNNDVKQTLGRRTVAKDKASLKSSLRRYMRRLQRQSEKIRAFFQAPTTVYAA